MPSKIDPTVKKIITGYAEAEYKKVKKVTKMTKQTYLATRISYYIGLVNSFNEMKSIYPTLFHSIPVTTENKKPITIYDLKKSHSDLKIIHKILTK